MPRIIDKIKDVSRRVLDEISNPNSNGSSPTAEMLREKATEAIIAGRTNQQGITPEWNDYMDMFAQGDAAHLARLNLTDNVEDIDGWMPRAVAYLISNGMCSTPTTGNMMRNMNIDAIKILDKPLPNPNP
jgi:hypothetical protein